MQNIDIRFIGTANFKQVQAQVAALQSQFEALNKRATSMAYTPGTGNVADWKRATNAVNAHNRAFSDLISSTGQWEISQARLNSRTQEFTEMLQKQKVTMGDMIKQRKIVTAAYREQIALQNMQVRSMGRDSKGRLVGEVYVPSEVSRELDTINKRLGYAGALTRSASMQMVNWGKNTQWAGRQLMVGFTIPLAALGAAAGVAAYKVDKELTRIAKVYDTTYNAMSSNEAERARAENEINNLRAKSLAAAGTAARTYGAAVEDTLKVQADLAATGLRGNRLIEATTEVVRIATLGELDYQQATETTIALQNAFKMSNKELTETFNFMNATENATSLSIQDIAEATPRAASAMAALNVTAQEMTVLLVAMKERGVDAAEGANALKSATTRILNPVKRAKEYFAEFGVNIQALSDESGGNLYRFLQLLSEATVGMGNLEKQRGVAALFGTYQYNRLNAALAGVTDAIFGFGDANSQTAKAVELMGESTTKLADLADMEIGRFQESASGKFKRALETMRYELARMGEPFLEMGASILEAVTGLMRFFNSLDDGKKKMIAMALAAVAVVGPLIMLTGLFMNLTGNIFKGIGTILQLGAAFKLFTKDQKAGILLTQLQEKGFIRDANAAQLLTAQMTALTAATNTANQAFQRSINQSYLGTGGASAIPGAVPSVMNVPGKGNYVQGANGLIVPASIATGAGSPAQSIKLMADGSEEVAKNTTTAAKSMKNFKVAALVGAGAITTMAVSGNSLVDNLSTAALNVALFAPMLMMIPWSRVGSGIKAFASAGVAKTIGSMSKSGSLFNLSTLGKVSTGLLRFLGPTGILIGVATGLYSIWKNAKKAGEEMEKLGSTSDMWSDIIGFEKVAPGAGMNADGTVTTPMYEMAKQVEKDAPELVKRIKAAGEDSNRAIDLAIQQGLQAMRYGATPDQARQAVEASLRAAFGNNESAIARLMAKVDLNLDFNVNEEVLDEQIRQVRNMIETAIEDEAYDMSTSESIVRFFEGQPGLSNEALAEAKNAGKALAEAVLQAPDDSTKMALLREFMAFQDDSMEQVAKNFISKAPEIAEKYNITDAASLLASPISNLLDNKSGTIGSGGEINFGDGIDALGNLERAKADQKEIEEIVNALGDDFNKIQTQSKNAEEGIKTTIDAFGEMANIDTEGVETFEELLRMMVPSYMSVIEASTAYNNEMNMMRRTGEAMNEQTMLNRLNFYRLRAGLEATGNVMDGFGDVTVKATDAQEGVAKGINKAGRAARNAEDDVLSLAEAYKELDLSGALRGAFEDTQRELADNAMDAFEERRDAALESMDNAAEAQMDRLEARQEAAQEAFDARWERRTNRVEASYDRRIEAVQNAIDAEKKAEEVRQRIFEAEMTRIRRLAEMANMNIDFNVALNSGSLDEAAKIRNDVMAREQEWALEDAAGKGSKTDRRIERLENRIEAIEDERDKRLDQLKKMEEDRRKSLQRQQEAERKAAEERIKINREAAEAKFEAEEKYLRKALDAFLEYVPTSEKELIKHIRNIDERYSAYGAILTRKGDQWAQAVGKSLNSNIRDAARSLRSEIEWSQIGQNAAEDMIAGAFGLTPRQFIQWMKTGTFPTKGFNPKRARARAAANNGTDNIGQAAIRGYSFGDQEVRHKGGEIGTGGGSRAGYPRNAAVRNSERAVIAKKGEFMMQKSAVSKYGVDFMKNVNSGRFGTDPGYGTGGGMGLAGIFGGVMGNALKMMMGQAIITAGDNALARATAGASFTAGKAGVYGDIAFDPEQLRNASIIASVGSNMGMSQRDIVIGLMTAMQESMLRNINYGDRDSLGLFQQRPSMGWGTPAQVTDPVYAARKFFSVLKTIEDRDNMPLTLAAQAVQRSAYPYAYAKWENEARAILSSMGRGQRPGTSGGFVMGPGGRFRPVASGGLTQGIHGSPPAVDFGIPVGTPVRAVADGVVSASYDIPGYEPRAAHGGLGYKSYGRLITIDHGGFTSLSAHLSRRFVNRGQKVRGGSTIGLSGNTGYSTGPHLHFGTSGISPMSFVSLAKGAQNVRWDNTLANLHKGEAVLTEDLNRKFHQGVENFANGGGNNYNVYVDARGNSDIDVRGLVREFRRELAKEESRKGVRRRSG